MVTCDAEGNLALYFNNWEITGNIGITAGGVFEDAKTEINVKEFLKMGMIIGKIDKLVNLEV